MELSYFMTDIALKLNDRLQIQGLLDQIQFLILRQLAKPQASGLAGWASGLAGWPRGGNGRTDGRMDGRTDVRTDGRTKSPHSTGLRPLSGPLPCFPKEVLGQ